MLCGSGSGPLMRLLSRTLIISRLDWALSFQGPRRRFLIMLPAGGLSSSLCGHLKRHLKEAKGWPPSSGASDWTVRVTKMDSSHLTLEVSCHCFGHILLSNLLVLRSPRDQTSEGGSLVPSQRLLPTAQPSQSSAPPGEFQIP